MNERTKTALKILQLAGVLGVLGDVLMRQVPWGLNVLLFNAVFAAAVVFLLSRHAPERLTRQTYALLAAVLFFASMFVWRDSIELRIADTFAIITILGVLFLPTLKISARVGGVVQYAIGVVWAALNSFFAPVALLASDIGWNELSITGWRKHAFAVIRSVLIATPIILVFGALFMAADAVYEGWIKSVFNVDFGNLVSHGLLLSLFAWLSAGYLRGILFAGAETIATGNLSVIAPDVKAPEDSPMDKVRAESGEYPVVLPENKTVVEHINSDTSSRTAEKSPPPNGSSFKSPDAKPSWSWANIDNSIVPGFTLGSVEIGVVLGLVNLLFLSFVIFQVPYLFGGMELVQSTPDFKLADYARRGFGELVAVSALVLPLLLFAHWLIKKDDGLAGTLFKIFAGVQIGLLFVIMASAVQRLVLLTGSLGYGMTTARLYPMIFMAWLAIVFLLFGGTVLRNTRQHFAWAALWSAFLVLGATHVLNPDEFIVKTNITLAQQGREFDAEYNSDLSDDALPFLLDSFASLNTDDQQTARRHIIKRGCEMREETDLRSWNISRWRAARMLNSNEEWVAEIGDCATYLVERHESE